MNRNIHVVDTVSTQNLEGFESVAISRTDDIVNYSVDTLYCSMINRFEEKTKDLFLNKLLRKIRLGGSLILRFIDTKTLAKMYWDNQITSQEFISKISNNNTLTTVEEINDKINNNEFILSKIEYREDSILISVVRKEIL
jgi:hypothetical protein